MPAETVNEPAVMPVKELGLPLVTVSAKTNEGIRRLKEELIVQAPKGRMILPQVQVIRDILDQDATMMVCKETELKEVLGRLNAPPNLVVTDSQTFGYVAEILQETKF